MTDQSTSLIDKNSQGLNESKHYLAVFQKLHCLPEGLLCIAATVVSQSGIAILHHSFELFAHAWFTFFQLLVPNKTKTSQQVRFVMLKSHSAL